MIGVLAAVREPERFARLVLVCPSPALPRRRGLRRRLPGRRHRGAARVAREQLPRVVERHGPGDHGEPRPARAGGRADRELLPDRPGDRPPVRPGDVPLGQPRRPGRGAGPRARPPVLVRRHRTHGRGRVRRPGAPGQLARGAPGDRSLPQPERPRGDRGRDRRRSSESPRGRCCAGSGDRGLLRGARRRQRRGPLRERPLRVPLHPHRRHHRQGQRHVPAVDRLRQRGPRGAAHVRRAS